MARKKASEGDPFFDEAGKKTDKLIIKPLKERTVIFEISGTVPLKQLRFSEKAKAAIMATQMAGSQAKGKKRVREKRDYDSDFKQSYYQMSDGSYGIPAAAFRNAMISACRTVGFAMTLAKLSIFCEEDGLDSIDETPLVRLEGKPTMSIDPVRNANGSCDLRARAKFSKWKASVRIRFDEDQFSLVDVANLFNRVARQVGIGEGRPDSKKSAGMGLGLFKLDAVKEVKSTPDVGIAETA